MSYNSQTSVYYLLNLHMQYEHIRFCSYLELTKVHNEYIKQLPNIIKVLEILYDNGSKIG